MADTFVNLLHFVEFKSITENNILIEISWFSSEPCTSTYRGVFLRYNNVYDRVVH